VLGLIAAGGLLYVGVERERPLLFAFAAAVLAVWLVIASSTAAPATRRTESSPDHAIKTA